MITTEQIITIIASLISLAAGWAIRHYGGGGLVPQLPTPMPSPSPVVPAIGVPQALDFAKLALTEIRGLIREFRGETPLVPANSHANTDGSPPQSGLHVVPVHFQISSAMQQNTP